MNQEVKYVAKYLHNFLTDVASASVSEPPPGTNAANGKWASKMFNEIYNKYHEKGNTEIENGVVTQGEDGGKLWGVYANFVTGNLNPFKNHKLHPGSAVDVFKIKKDAIFSGFKVLLDLIVIISSSSQNSDNNSEAKRKDDEAKRNAQEQLARDVQTFMAALKDDQVNKGEHANGWIASDYYTQVNLLIPLYKERFKEALTTDEGKCLQVILIELINKLATQPLGTYNPWLDANWQGQYTTTIMAGKAAVELYFPGVANWQLSDIVESIRKDRGNNRAAA